MEVELGQQVVEFSSLFRRAAEHSYVALGELVERSKSSEQPDSEKKIELLKYILKTRQRMLRLHVLAKWCKQAPLVQYCQQLASTLSSHDTCFTQAADSLFFMHEGLQQARAPIYDVPSAIEVLLTGSYQKLPKCIEDIGLQSVLSEDEQKPVLKKLDMLLRSKILDVTLPKEVSNIKISDGTLLLRVDGEFEVLLTLGYRGHLSLWRILHLKMLVGEKNGPVKLEESRRYALGDELERRMAAAENPFVVLYSFLHEFSVALVMDTMIRQAQVLRQGRWRDAIRFELTNENSTLQCGNTVAVQIAQDGEPDTSSLKTPGMKIIYWLDLDKTNAGSDSSFSPFIKIEPGADLQILCSHSAFVLDALSDTEAELSLDQSCIDVEKLLLRAIACSRHTRLLEIHRDLLKNAQIFQDEGDVILQRQGVNGPCTEKAETILTATEYWTDEVLQVRAYGSMYITLGINIRNGRFRLQSSKNVFGESVLIECEEALNQGSMTAAEVFISLRSKSILHLFASTGRFLGLKVYEQGLAYLKIPKIVLDGSDLLLLGFPQLGTSYVLMLQLDKDFKLLFKLLEIYPDLGRGSNSTYSNTHTVRFHRIDVAQMDLADDELNLSLLDWEKLNLILTKKGEPIESSEHVIVQDKPSETSIIITGRSQSGFSSLVDEVFELEKDSTATLPNQNHLQSFNLSLYPHMSSNLGAKGVCGSPKKEGVHYPHPNNNIMVSSGSPTWNNMKPLYQNGLFNSFNKSRSSPETLSRSTSDLDNISVRSPFSGDGHSSSLDDETKLPGSAPSVNRRRQFSPLQTSSQPSAGNNNNKKNGSKNSGGSLHVTKPMCQIPCVASPASSSDIILKQNVDPRKRGLSDILPLIPSLQELDSDTGRKRRKLLPPTHPYPNVLQTSALRLTSKYTYDSLLADTKHCLAPSNIYLTSLLHAIRHCSLFIKHAQLTGQMDALGIPYVEEVGLCAPSSSLWFCVPFAKESSWTRIRLCLGKPGSMSWDVKVNDPYFEELWMLHKGSTSTAWGSGVRIANASDTDSHIRYDSDGILLSYETVEPDSVKKLVSDLRRLFNARLFACGMRKLLAVKSEEVPDDGNINSEVKSQSVLKATGEFDDKICEQIRRAFKIEAVGLVSLWFYYGSMPIMAHFVVEWETGKEGCTMHVSPDQLWPHTKFLEDFINGAEVASFLDCVRLTAGPLLALGTAIRPARMPAAGVSGPSPVSKQISVIQSQGVLPTSSASNANHSASSCHSGTTGVAPLGNQSLHNSAMLTASGRGGPGIVPSSLLPIDVSVVLRGPYWIRIIYRKKFAVDMRCYAGDQVWLQPATPPKGGPSAGGSLPCPQFRPFIMEHVAQGLNAMEPNFPVNLHSGSVGSVGSANLNTTTTQLSSGTRGNTATSVGVSRAATAFGGQGSGGLNRVGNAMLASLNLAAVTSGLPIRISPGTGVPVHVKGELNTAFIGLGDDGGYGGGWVPLAALKKVLRGILKYLGVLWLFAQLPELLKDILGSILKENEGALLNLDQEQPTLRFFVGGYVFAVSVHRVQLLLQVLSVKRFHHQQQQAQSNSQEELTSTEISEICDYFSRRVASEPYDASRVASFVTILTLPISVIREFLKLIAWEKGLSHAQGADSVPTQRPRVELCLENHSGMVYDENMASTSVARSNIHHDRAHDSVDFALTFVLDHAFIPHCNAAGGAAWLPYCVSVALKFSFGDSAHVSLIGMDGSHGGRACWRSEDWEKCKQRIARAVDFGSGNSAGDVSQGRLKLVAEILQRTLQGSLQQLRDTTTSNSVAT